MVQISVKNVDKTTFKKFKAVAAERGMTVGEALNLAMRRLCQERVHKNRFTDLKPKSWGKGNERASENIDDILYGEK